jgi:hypothetical protein
MLLHTFYVLAGQEDHIVPRSVLLRDVRLRLPNGEVKVPHGGLSLLCQVGSQAGRLEFQGQRWTLVGRALVRGNVRTPTGSFCLLPAGSDTAKALPYQVAVAFRGSTRLPSLQQFRDAHAVEFVVTGLRPEGDPSGLLCDPATLRQLDRQVLGQREGELSTDELVRLLGGDLSVGSVRFDAEGAFREA